MTRELVVYRPDGSVYFRTVAAYPWRPWSPEHAKMEADFWRNEGYRVEFEDYPEVPE